MKLTEHFDSAEFDCHDGTEVPEKYLKNAKEVAENLEVLRSFLKKPVAITGSGYRTPTYNKKVDGAKFSQHLTSSASDISVEDIEPKEVAGAIEKLIAEKKMKQGGIGIYPTFVHYDIRGTKARWTKK